MLSCTNMYRINALLRSDQRLFHTQDLALLWQTNNKNSLYTRIKRYIDRGILIPIHKGFYATAPIDGLNPLRLGIGYLHHFAYLSCESILAECGVIFQHSNYLTLVANRSTRFRIGDRRYLVRKLQEKYLFNYAGLVEEDGVYKAALERAVADILYFNRRYYFDAKDKIPWSQVKKIQKEVYRQ